MQNATAKQLIETKERIRALFADGELPYVIHLGGGNEEQLIQIFHSIQPGDWIFASHRAHYHYMLAGGTADELIQEIKDGHSMHLFSKERNFLTSSILAGNCGVAAGVAWALKQEGSQSKVWCFVGDGAEDEGAFYEAVNFVEGWDLPCMFVIEDNDKSVDTTKVQRRGGMNVAHHHRWDHNQHVHRYHYTFTEPHCGPGLKQQVTFNPQVIEKYLAEKNY